MKNKIHFQKIINNNLFKDSFWAISGNGIGNALLLFSGIIIARYLGKDLYGEYGIVKTTMFYIASFATLGLGFTSTKYIADFVCNNPTHLKSIVRDSIAITILFSSFIAFLLFIFAQNVATFLEEPRLIVPLRILAIVIILKAITTTQIGILSGFKDFKKIAYNSLYSGLFMIIICIPLTILFSLAGALSALLLSQLFNAVINYFAVKKNTNKLTGQENHHYSKELVKFSFPVALQESSFTICHWSAIMLLTKYSSMGEVGLYTAGAQWNSIILMIPIMLNNVVLSYLSSSVKNKQEHSKTIKTMLSINLICAVIPFVIVYIFAEYISSFYGSSFSELTSILRILTLSTVFETCSTVFKSELLAIGKTWLLFTLRFSRDLMLVTLVYIFLSNNNGDRGAYIYSWICVIISFLFFCSLTLSYITNCRNKQKDENKY